MPGRKRLIWVGDAACPSGFALSTHKILDVLRRDYDVTVLGINYRGDPHDWPYPIYAAAAEGDAFGVARLVWLCDKVQPDVIVLQNDPWNIPFYLQQLKGREGDKTYDGQYGNVPVVAIIAIDGKNCAGSALNGLSLAVFWTQFALDEARNGGYTGPAAVIPLGVDLEAYYQMDKYEARQRLGLPAFVDDAFIVGNVNRNQPRKRWDLTLRYFAKWVNSGRLKDAYLFLHVAPTGDMGINVKQLARYYGIMRRLILHEPPVFYGVGEDVLRWTYNAFDVQVSTSQGEGFGLTTLEGMACRTPQLFGDWSALGEWAKRGGVAVPCTSTCVGPPYVNVLGGIPDEAMFVHELDRLYADREHRAAVATRGYDLAHEGRFSWRAIGEEFLERMGLVLEQTEASMDVEGVV